MYRNRSNALMNHWCLFRWMSLALWHSLVTFFVQVCKKYISIWKYGQKNRQRHKCSCWDATLQLKILIVQYFTWTGTETDLWSLQMSLGQSIVIVVNCKLLLESRYWNLPLILSVIFSILSFTFLTVVTQVQITWLTYILRSSFVFLIFNTIFLGVSQR